jgi:HemK-like putative methylase
MLDVKNFDIIVSNPPYIAASDPHLASGDLRFEPRQALASGADGLDDLRQIITGAPAHLVEGGWLLLEHGCDQAAASPPCCNSTALKPSAPCRIWPVSIGSAPAAGQAKRADTLAPLKILLI